MSGETSGEVPAQPKEDRFMELAQEAHDLWGRILDAQMEHIVTTFDLLPNPKGMIWVESNGHAEFVSGYPRQLDADEVILQRLDRQAFVARKLFDQALNHANEAAVQQEFSLTTELETAAGEEGSVPTMREQHEASLPRSVEPRRRRQPKPEKRPTFTAFTRSQEEIEEYTAYIIDVELPGKLGVEHRRRHNELSDEAQRREFLAAKTKIYVKHGDEKAEAEMRNRFISEQDGMSQVVLWTGQANGPRQLPHRPHAADRANFALNMINLGRVDPMEAGEYWELVGKAVDEDLLTGVEDAQLTTRGLERVRELVAEDLRTRKGTNY